jgi:hypothetical protein
VTASPKPVISNVRVSSDPTFAKVIGRVLNPSSRPVGVAIKCRLRDTSGRVVGVARGRIAYLRPHSSTARFTPIAAGQTSNTADSASCSARALAPVVAVPPSPPPPIRPSFAPASIAFFDRDHGIAVGSFGRQYCSARCRAWIEITSDAGLTWTRVKTTPFAMDEVTVAGHSAWVTERCPGQGCPATTLWSTDGGKTWKSLGSQGVTELSFVSDTVGYAIRQAHQKFARSVIMRSIDAGRTWQPVGHVCDFLWGAWLSFVSPTHGWLLCNGEPSAGSEGTTVYESNDSGTNWRPIAGVIRTRFTGGLTGTGYPGAIFFRPDGRGWIGIGYAALYVVRSQDAGRHWQGQGRHRLQSGLIPNTDGGGFQSLWFTNDRVGYALVYVFGGPEELAVSNDGGLHWRVIHRWRLR